MPRDLSLIKMVVYSDLELVCSPDTVKKIAGILGSELESLLNRKIEVTILPNNMDDEDIVVGFTTPDEGE